MSGLHIPVRNRTAKQLPAMRPPDGKLRRFRQIPKLRAHIGVGPVIKMGCPRHNLRQCNRRLLPAGKADYGGHISSPFRGRIKEGLYKCGPPPPPPPPPGGGAS